MQSQKWSNFFDENNKPQYSYDSIIEKLNRINKQNNLISSYLNTFDCEVKYLTYENLIANPITILRDALSTDLISDDAVKSSTIQKQANNLNSEWYSRFAKEYFDNEKLNTHLVDCNETIRAKFSKLLSIRKDST
jgi:LPS sulfotransferase NodH